VEVAQKERGNFAQKIAGKNRKKSKLFLPDMKNKVKQRAKSPKKTIYWGGGTIFSVVLSKYNLPCARVKKTVFVKMWENRHKCTKYVFCRQVVFCDIPLYDTLFAVTSGIDFFRLLWYDIYV